MSKGKDKSWELIGKDQDGRYVLKNKDTFVVFSTTDKHKVTEMIGDF